MVLKPGFSVPLHTANCMSCQHAQQKSFLGTAYLPTHSTDNQPTNVQARIHNLHPPFAIWVFHVPQEFLLASHWYVTSELMLFVADNLHNGMEQWGNLPFKTICADLLLYKCLAETAQLFKNGSEG